MSGMWGADVAKLEDLSRTFQGGSDALRDLQRDLGGTINSVGWAGGDGELFLSDWQGRHTAALTAAINALSNMAGDLRTHVREQLEASGELAGTAGSAAAPVITVLPSDSSSGGGTDSIRKLLESLGLSADVIDELLTAIDLAFLEEIASTPGLAAALDVAGRVVDVVSFIVDFAEAFSMQPDLPMDERLIFSIAYAGLNFGIGEATTILGAAIGSIIPVGGTMAGTIAGKIIGYGLGKGYDFIDGQIGATEFMADQLLDTYQWAKSHDFNQVSMAWDAGGKIIDGISDAGDAVSNVIDGGIDSIAGGIVDVGGSVIDRLGF